MKKSILIIVITASLLIAGCADKSEKTGAESTTSSAVTTAVPESLSPEEIFEIEGDTYTITEENYFAGVQEIYKNPDKYIGKRVEFEGEYVAELYIDEMYYQVYRYVTVTGRHVDEDGSVYTHEPNIYTVGFRIKYDGNKPTNKSFVKVSGIVDTYEENGESKIVINADVLEKCENPGKVNLLY